MTQPDTVTRPPATVRPSGEAARIERALDLTFLRMVELIREHVEERLAHIESQLDWICEQISVEQDLTDTRYALLKDGVAAAVATRHASAGPLEVLGTHAHRCRYASDAELADRLRNAAGALERHVARRQVRAEHVLEMLVDAAEGRLEPDAVAAIVMPALTPTGRRR